MKSIICYLVLVSMIYAQGSEELLNSSPFASDNNEVVLDSAYLDEEPKYKVREFDHQEQIITGGVMMLMIGVMMISSNNFNPKHPAK